MISPPPRHVTENPSDRKRNHEMNQEPPSEAPRRENRDGLAAIAILIVSVLAIALVIVSVI